MTSNFILIFGPSAVGKMTVGQELSKLSGYPLFHNHLTVDAIVPVFPFGSKSYKRLVFETRCRVFEEAASSTMAGLIFTFVWPLDSPESSGMVTSWCEIFRSASWTITFAELTAELETRVERNRSVNRLLHKSAKRDVHISDFLLRKNDVEWRANSRPGEAFPIADRHILIDTERAAPLDSASQIYAALDSEKR